MPNYITYGIIMLPISYIEICQYFEIKLENTQRSQEIHIITGMLEWPVLENPEYYHFGKTS